MDNESWVLVFSAVVSCVHVLFDVLAIKNDISFWASRSSFAGLSASNVATSLVLRSVVRVTLPYPAPLPAVTLTPCAANNPGDDLSVVQRSQSVGGVACRGQPWCTGLEGTPYSKQG